MSQLPKAKKTFINLFPKKVRIQKTRKIIHGLLDRENPQPIGLHHCMDILFDKKAEDLSESGGRIDEKRCAHHSSIVMGRRPFNGKCQLLVRTTFGERCHDFDWECDKGQLWIDEEQLSANVFGFVWIPQ